MSSAPPAGPSSTHLEYPGKLWNTAGPGSPMVMRLKPDSEISDGAIFQSKSRLRRGSDEAPDSDSEAECNDGLRHRISDHRAPLPGRFDGKSCGRHAGGDPVALHQMRIALTHLRTAILFFSPMVVESSQAQIRAELKWLNAQLGTMRDLDVAIERLKFINKRRPGAIPPLSGLDHQASGHPSSSGAGTPVSQVSPPGQECIRLDRARTLVDQEGKAANPEPGRSNPGLQHPQTEAMAEQASEKEPQAFENGCREAASAAAAEQED